jgi:hypothetical protein
MEIDERLFEAFSPNELKDALDEAAEIELPPIRPTWGGTALAPMRKLLVSNLLGPMTKLGAALVMVAIFAAATVAPQAQLARDAGTVLCGMRPGPVVGGCAIARAPPPHSTLCRWPDQLGVRYGQARQTVVGRLEQRGGGLG